MYTARNYVRASGPEEAWALNQKRNHVILAGGCWLRMGRAQYDTLIDLSQLGLDTIEEQEGRVTLGAMVSLRQVETSPVLQKYYGDYFYHCTKHIVGVQFRNCATLGGSVAARFGFSDPVTALLPLDCEVELVKGGLLPLRDYVQQKADRDVLLRVHLHPDAQMRMAYESMRNTETDLPVLTCAVAKGPWGWRCAIGGRASRPTLAQGTTWEEVSSEVESWTYVDNLRGSGAYRRHLAHVLMGRAKARLEQGGCV